MKGLYCHDVLVMMEAGGLELLEYLYNCCTCMNAWVFEISYLQIMSAGLNNLEMFTGILTVVDTASRQRDDQRRGECDVLASRLVALESSLSNDLSDDCLNLIVRTRQGVQGYGQQQQA